MKILWIVVTALLAGLTILLGYATYIATPGVGTPRPVIGLGCLAAAVVTYFCGKYAASLSSGTTREWHADLGVHPKPIPKPDNAELNAEAEAAIAELKRRGTGS